MKFEEHEVDGHTEFHFDDGTVCRQAPGGPVTCDSGEGAGVTPYLTAIAKTRNPETKDAAEPSVSASQVQSMIDKAVAAALAAQAKHE